MNLRTICCLLVTLAAACTTTVPLPPPPAPEYSGEIVSLDPRFGSAAITASGALAHGLEALDAGLLDEADAHFARAVTQQQGSGIAHLGRAIVAFRKDDLDSAEQHLAAATRNGSWTAADILEAEIAHARGRTEEAISIYRAITDPDATSIASTRIEDLERALFDQLFARAGAEAAAPSVETLRRALTLFDTEPARLLLARRLIELGRYDEARRALDQLQIRGAVDEDQLQELMAEVEVGKGRYQEAIARLEPLARQDPARYGARLEEIKRRWSDANMPSQFHAALASDAVTRSELAIIVYWKLPAVRFARNLSEPPIAVDLTYGPGREEMIRALALGLFPVDQVTRTASPGRLVTVDAFERIAARLARLGGIPECAVPVAGDPGAELASCGVPLPQGEPLTGADVSRTIDAIAALHP